MHWARKNRLWLLCASVAGLLFVALMSSFLWSSLFLPIVIIGLCAIILPFGLALYADNRRMAYILLCLAGLSLFAGVAIFIEHQTRLGAFTETCNGMQGTVLTEDFQYLCLNSNQETSITSIDSLSGAVMNWGIVWYAATVLVCLLYLAYRAIRIGRASLVKRNRRAN